MGGNLWKCSYHFYFIRGIGSDLGKRDGEVETVDLRIEDKV